MSTPLDCGLGSVIIPFASYDKVWVDRNRELREAADWYKKRFLPCPFKAVARRPRAVISFTKDGQPNLIEGNTFKGL